MSCDKQMQAQLKASQSRVSFLDQEIQCLSGRNERLVKEMECSNDRLCSRNQELRDKIRELEQLVLDEHAGFYKKTGGNYMIPCERHYHNCREVIALLFV